MIPQVQDELSQVGDALSAKLSKRGPGRSSEQTAWPRDMNDESEQTDDWGADPPEVGRG